LQYSDNRFALIPVFLDFGMEPVQTLTGIFRANGFDFILFFPWLYRGKHLALPRETGSGSSFLSKAASIPLSESKGTYLF
jgi:hypothetical protein